MRGNAWRAGAIITGLIVAVLAIVLVAWNINPPAGASDAADGQPSSSTESSSDSSSTQSTTPTSTDADEPDTDIRVPADAWDVNAAQFAVWQQKCGTILDRSSIDPPAADDQTDFVLKGQGKAVTDLAGYGCHLATNPTVGDMLIHGTQEIKLPSGKTIGDNNPWMGEFIAKSKGGLIVWVEKDSSGNLFVSEAYQHYAFNSWTLLQRLKNIGIGVNVATWHYPLEALTAAGLPRTFKDTHAYKGEFLRLAYTQKGRTCPFWVIGINTSDGRLALLKNECGKVVNTTQAKTTSVRTTGSTSVRTTSTPSTQTTAQTTSVRTTGSTPVRTTSTVQTTTTPPVTTPSLAPKTGSNPAITQSENHAVNSNDGSTDSQGLQKSPQAGASKASVVVSSSNAVKSSDARVAASNADVDSGGGDAPHESASKPGSDW